MRSLPPHHRALVVAAPIALEAASGSARLTSSIGLPAMLPRRADKPGCGDAEARGASVVAIVGELEPTGMAEPGLAALPSGTKTFNTRPGCADGEYGRR